MKRSGIHCALRALTLLGSAGALLALLWVGQGQAAVQAGAGAQVGADLRAGADFDPSRVKLVVFLMSSCGHCKNFKKELAALAAAFPTLKIETVEYVPGATDAKNRAAQARMGLAQIQGFPTTLVFVDGASVGKVSGYRPAKDVVATLSAQVRAADQG